MTLLMMDGDLLMILTVTVNVTMTMMMTIKTMIMKRGSCQEKNSLRFFFSLCTTVLFLALAGLSRDKR